MKRILAFILAAVMCMSCAFAEGMGAKLTEITIMVKDALDIGDQYTDFSSSNFDDRWDLYWSSDAEEISVHCDSDGTIYSYYFYEYDYTYDSSFSPRYPDIDAVQLGAIADEFLARVITGDNEGWELGEITGSLRNGNYATSVTVDGRLTMMGVPTDIMLSLTIDAKTGRVMSYYRSDNYVEYAEFSGDLTEAVSDDTAREMLAAANSMELVYYVTEPGEMARLVYKPVVSENYAVRASDGQLINVDEFYMYDYATAEDSGAGGVYGSNRKLTEAELEGISVYENALAATEIDAILRAMPELGLTEEYAISGADYYDNGTCLVAELHYSRRLTEPELEARGLSGEYYDEKSIVAVAADGKPVSIYSYYPGTRSEVFDVDLLALEGVADSFIRTYYPEYNDTIVSESTTFNEYSYSWERSLTVNYSRTHNGHPFPANSISVTVNAETGTIDGMHINWNNSQEFHEPAAAELITADAAYAVYLDSFEFEKAFLSIPGEKISDWEYEYVLTYSWHYRDVESCYCVDAVTGEAMTRSTAVGEFEYDDISGHEYEAEIKKLGQYGIGFTGGQFMPDAPFDAEDALVFICQTPDYYESHTVEARSYDEKLTIANNMGATGLEAFEPDQQLTRLDYVKILLGMSGYDKALVLPGIYFCGFADDAEIAAEDYPAIAIAYALGLITTDADGNINAYKPLTRAEGALIFHKLLSLK